MSATFEPRQVLEFWFPDDGHWETLEAHIAFWTWRMQGGADEDICARFADLTLAAARGELDHWADTAYGRLALLIALDQFPRSLWRDTPAAYSQDIKANLLLLEGIDIGHYGGVTHPWERQFYIIALGHCEGPDHLQRLDLAARLVGENAAILPPQLQDLAERGAEMVTRVRNVIEAFGRHPHRNAILGRISTPAEEAYIGEGDFPHLTKMPGQSAI